MDTVIDRFDVAAKRFADCTAVQDATASLTYGELAKRVWGVAAAVNDRLDRPGPVVVLTPHDVSSAAAVLGVLASGRGVIPLDVDHPDARNRLIAEQATAAGVVTTLALADHARALVAADAVVLIDRLEASAPPEPRPTSADLAYILYTSGSTGAPKGVFQDHRSLLADILHSVRSFELSPEDRAALFYPPAVAAGLRAMLGTLAAGATAHLLAPRTLGGRGLVSEIHSRKITVFRSSATLFRRVVDVAGEGELESLRLVALGGDRVDWADYDSFRRICRPDARFASHLGATECSLYAEWLVDEEARGNGGALPVGRPIPGYRITLVDSTCAAVTDGQVGEFVVESRRLARGYWRDPERTAEAFLSCPDDVGLRAYRTGDLGRLRPDGLYEFVGRGDQQIKLRGFRIELGEIESALRACPGVKDGAVVTRSSPEGSVRSLAAYVELTPDGADLLPRHLMAMLSQKLPAHMVPADIVILDALPWLANFKIDRQRLNALDAERVERIADFADDPVTAEIARAYATILRLEGVTPGDDLLSLGGDSLQAVDIALEIEQRLGVKVAPEMLDMSCAIGDLADRLGLRRLSGASGEA
jgi:amino acid adenylation domain-containing protein